MCVRITVREIQNRGDLVEIPITCVYETERRLCSAGRSLDGLVRGERLLRTDQKQEDGHRPAGDVRRKPIEEMAERRFA